METSACAGNHFHCVTTVCAWRTSCASIEDEAEVHASASEVDKDAS